MQQNTSRYEHYDPRALWGGDDGVVSQENTCSRSAKADKRAGNLSVIAEWLNAKHILFKGPSINPDYRFSTKRSASGDSISHGRWHHCKQLLAPYRT